MLGLGWVYHQYNYRDQQGNHQYENHPKQFLNHQEHTGMVLVRFGLVLDWCGFGNNSDEFQVFWEECVWEFLARHMRMAWDRLRGGAWSGLVLLGDIIVRRLRHAAHFRHQLGTQIGSEQLSMQTLNKKWHWRIWLSKHVVSKKQKLCTEEIQWIARPLET